MTAAEKLKQFKEEIGKVIIGQDKVMELVFISLIQEGHILFDSVPGTGKTVLSKAVAGTVDGDFSRIQFTPDVLPTDITGMNMYNLKTQSFDLRMGPVKTNILLADEINRATPRTQSALLEVMEERQVTIDGERVKLDDLFIVLATQNPIESRQGTFDLPEAQMDRFLMKITLGYPKREEELKMLDVHKEKKNIEVNPVFTRAEIMALREQAADIRINDTVKEYIIDIVQKTREHKHAVLGVSPRGALGLMRAAMGVALINNRDYVTPEDVKYIAPYVLAHRIVLNIEGMTLTTEQALIEEILNATAVPVEFGVSRDEV
ncbi:MoxR-like ATPase [Jeotgalicoccus coquinae]|uniref:MoxR-like ATPase n=1 Tax=Jeotgalicoccus coquinae TaxID=709509 RepID=A0A6V7RR69_9STAP|nr:MoxR family ATPase [Jeotgalicoccus coquinae]MBB6424216.1 MoxR-like ATPase [Jeotgalicoccus coquinae]GGE25561.1 MoxR-like ATPase [Jeotgalicoccus coquinae]CAD2081549.1 replication factor C small subunit [Jeotgalicoccus coquinae]